MMFLASSYCSIHGLMVSVESLDATVILKGQECHCAKVTNYTRLSAETMGELEEVLDAERFVNAAPEKESQS